TGASPVSENAHREETDCRHRAVHRRERRPHHLRGAEQGRSRAAPQGRPFPRQRHLSQLAASTLEPGHGESRVVPGVAHDYALSSKGLSSRGLPWPRKRPLPLTATTGTCSPCSAARPGSLSTSTAVKPNPYSRRAASSNSQACSHK